MRGAMRAGIQTGGSMAYIYLVFGAALIIGVCMYDSWE